MCDSLTRQLSVFFDVDEQEFVSRAKYVFTYLQARFLRNDVPTSPTGWSGFHGAFRRWIKSRLICYNRKNIHLFFSLLQAKRSCEPLSDAYIRELSYPEHAKAMQTPDPLSGNEKTIVEKRTAFFEAVRPVLANIRAQLEFVSDKRLWLEEHKGSQSASYGKSRANGGQAAAVGEALGIPSYEVGLSVDEDIVSANFEFLSSRQIDTMAWYPRLETPVQHSMVLGSRSYAVKGVTIAPGVVEKRIHPLHDHFVRNIRKAAHMPHWRHLRAEVYAVKEPLKARMITKGEAVPYYFSKGLQKAVHTIMRRIPAFRLIGRPASPCDLIDLTIGKKGPDLFWISGDYKASTDNVSGIMGLMYMAYIIEDLDDNDIDVFMSVLGKHVIEYPGNKRIEREFARIERRILRRYGETSEQYQAYLDKYAEYQNSLTVVQTNGQLMGSPLSFIILCLLNLSLYLRVRQENDPDYDFDLEMRRVLINGDDILFVGTTDEYKSFVRIGDELGLSTSVGKTYIHHRYANVNSTCFDYDLRSASSTPYQVNYLNTGLYFGQGKVMARDDEEEQERDLVSTINQIVSGALPSRAAQILKNFLSIHRDGVNAVTKGRNLFIHESLGGCGVKRPIGFELKVSDEQHTRALLLYKATNRRVVRSPPLFGAIAQPTSNFVEPWDTVVPKEVERFRTKPADHAWIQRRRLPDWLLEIGVVTSS